MTEARAPERSRAALIALSAIAAVLFVSERCSATRWRSLAPVSRETASAAHSLDMWPRLERIRCLRNHGYGPFSSVCDVVVELDTEDVAVLQSALGLCGEVPRVGDDADPRALGVLEHVADRLARVVLHGERAHAHAPDAPRSRRATTTRTSTPSVWRSPARAVPSVMYTGMPSRLAQYPRTRDVIGVLVSDDDGAQGLRVESRASIRSTIRRAERPASRRMLWSAARMTAAVARGAGGQHVKGQRIAVARHGSMIAGVTDSRRAVF